MNRIFSLAFVLALTGAVTPGPMLALVIGQALAQGVGAALPILAHAQFQVGNTARFKIAPLAGSIMTALDAVTPLSLDLTGRCYRDLAPFNLRVNGAATDATYAPETDLSLSSEAPSALARLPREVTLSGALEFRADDDTLLQSLSVPARLENYPVPWSQLSGWLGSGADFRVRLGLVFTAPWFTLQTSQAQVRVRRQG